MKGHTKTYSLGLSKEKYNKKAGMPGEPEINLLLRGIWGETWYKVHSNTEDNNY